MLNVESIGATDAQIVTLPLAGTETETNSSLQFL